LPLQKAQIAAASVVSEALAVKTSEGFGNEGRDWKSTQMPKLKIAGVFPVIVRTTWRMSFSLQ